MIYLGCHLKWQSSAKLSYNLVLPYSQGPVQDVTRGNEGVEDSTARISRQGIYLPKYITLGLLGVVCGDKGRRAAFMCGLLTTKCSHHQEQVSTLTH
jgi:hypothetical protein